MCVKDFIPPETFPVQTSLGRVSVQVFHDKNKIVVSVREFFDGTKTFDNLRGRCHAPMRLIVCARLFRKRSSGF